MGEEPGEVLDYPPDEREVLGFQDEELADLRAREEQALRDANTAYLDQLLKDGAEIVRLKE